MTTPEQLARQQIDALLVSANRRLSLIRGAEVHVSANLARAKRLRQSILQAAFAQPGSADQYGHRR